MNFDDLNKSKIVNDETDKFSLIDFSSKTISDSYKNPRNNAKVAKMSNRRVCQNQTLTERNTYFQRLDSEGMFCGSSSWH